MKYRLQLAMLLGVLVLLVASTSSFSQVPTLPGQAGVPTSSTVSGSQRSIRVDNAQVVSMHKIPIAAQADGLISQLLADEGRAVKKGDTLLVVDNRVALAELEVAKKELEAAEKQAQQTAEVEYAKQASRVSDAEYEDIYKLYNQGSANYSEARRKQLEKERARLGIEVAEVKHEQEVLAAAVNQEKVKASQVRLSLFDVVAPYDGVIVQRLHDAGEWIRAGEPVLRLVHLNEMKIETFVPIDGITVSALQGAPMKVVVPLNAQDVATYETQIEVVSAEIESRRVRVSARIQNQQVGGAWLLRDGMIANVEIIVTQ
jgi:multidrug efflux pump subunit AcrA (membrane-fusion protein)